MSKYCINCGKEIPQNIEQDTCKRCQNKKNGKFRKGIEIFFGGLLSIVLLIITKGKFRGFKL
jgi:predicted nucleic acid-binding Zn ribbon protein